MTSASDVALPISYEALQTLAADLKPDALGVAIRLIAYQVRNGVGLADEAAPHYLKLQKRSWERLSGHILKHFRIVDGQWVYPHPLACQEDEAVKPAARSRPQGTLFSMTSSRRSAPVVDGAGINPQSLGSIAFERGVMLLMRFGRSEVQARSFIGRLRKDYDDAFVISVIDSVLKQGDISEPASWMSKAIQQYPTRDAVKQNRGRQAPAPQRNGMPPHKPHPISSPEFLNVSESTAQRIRKQNAGRHHQFVYDDAGLAKEAV